MIIAPEKFHDDEYTITREILEKNSVSVDVASLDVTKATGYKKLEIITDLNISDIVEERYDGIVIIGGFGVKNFLWKETSLHNLVQKFYNHKKLVGAICLAPVCLANAGILKGKKACVYKNKHALEAFEKMEVEYLLENVIISDNIITANGPKSSKQFALTIVDMLNDKI